MFPENVDAKRDPCTTAGLVPFSLDRFVPLTLTDTDVRIRYVKADTQTDPTQAAPSALAEIEELSMVRRAASCQTAVGGRVII